MSITEKEASAQVSADKCPVDYSAWSHQKTVRQIPVEDTEASIEQDANGVWHIHGFEETRTVLRNSSATKQAGFQAEGSAGNLPELMRRPILYLEGKEHQQLRKQTARFFTPKAVSSNYRQLMERLADQLISELQQHKQADLSQLSLTMAVRVAGEVVGLTNSRPAGMTRRLDAFFANPDSDTKNRFVHRLKSLRANLNLLSFFFLDVKPAIKARKQRPQEDVISHLLSQNYKDSEILIECVTYGAAGMATTREFISVAAWHFLEQPELRVRYLAATEDERSTILQEILRIEPVVGNLYRRTTAEICIEKDGTQTIIPTGALVDLDIHAANTDESVVGAEPLAICPARELHGDRVPSALMSFGDGHHRCPGSYIAIQETDIFLQRLLKLDGLYIKKQPQLTWNKLTTGYELRKFILALT